MSIGAELKRLGGQTLVYGLGTILVRALGFLLLPLYTRYLSKHDYGIVALANSVVGVLVLVLPLSLHGALNRLHADARDDGERRRVVGTLSVTASVVAAAMALLLDATGELWTPWISPDIPFRPYLRMTVWMAFFTSIGYVPATLLQVRERPVAYAVLTAVPALATIGFIVWEVVYRGAGAAGYLRGGLWGAAVGAIPSVWIALRCGGAAFRLDPLRSALVYCLPLVVQGVSAWMLSLSDRVLLNRFVPLDHVGLYGVAAQIAGVVTIAAWAMNSAWIPFLFRTESESGADAPARIARLVTYFAAAVTWVALGVALGGRDLLVVLSAPAYREAGAVLPLLAASLWLGALYLVPAGFLFLKSRTGLIPVLTTIGGLVSIGLNLFLVPRYGYVAAGWGALAGQALHLVLVWIAARGTYPVPYEVGRIGRILLVGPALFFLGRLLPQEPWGVTLAGRIAVWAAFPIALALTGFLNGAERQAIGRRWKTNRDAASDTP